MSGRLVSCGVAIALLVGLIALGGAIVAACYDVPTPDCGFVCGPAGECPDGYACATDQRCHRLGAPASLVCESPDAGDAGADSPAGSDASAHDASDGGASDTGVDAPP